MVFRTIGAQLLDWIFPPVCFGCGREGAWLCPAALAHARQLKPDVKKVIPGIQSIVLGSYDDPLLGAMVRSLKYNGWHGGAAAIKELIPATISSLIQSDTPVIVPVPLHPRRRRERGFNQSDLISLALANGTGWRESQLLVRHRYTQPQASLSGAKRQTNIHHAFRLRSNIAPVPKCVILVDDVITTGATLRECVAVLHTAGVETIYTFALAKG